MDGVAFMYDNAALNSISVRLPGKLSSTTGNGRIYVIKLHFV